MNRISVLGIVGSIGAGCGGQIDPESNLAQTAARATSSPAPSSGIAAATS